MVVREAIDSGLLFTQPLYSASIAENVANVTVVTVVNTVGQRLNEPLKYTLLNPGGRFIIRPTCGVVLTTGVRFDREEEESYELVVEVNREDEILRVARVTVRVQVGVETCVWKCVYVCVCVCVHEGLISHLHRSFADCVFLLLTVLCPLQTCLFYFHEQTLIQSLKF